MGLIVPSIILAARLTLHVSTSESNGFLYLAFGDRYLKEAHESAKQLRKFHTEPIALMTPTPPPEHLSTAFTKVIILPFQFDYIDKTLIAHSPFHKTIHLDTDTWLTGSMNEIFEALERFDIAVQFTIGGGHYSFPDVPAAFREPSAGVIGYRASVKMQRFFEEWRNEYQRIEDIQGQKGAWDQRSLRRSLYNSDLRIFPLPTEFQFYTCQPNIAMGRIHMIHGRNLRPLSIKEINATTAYRIWIPKVGNCPVPSHGSLADMGIFILRFTLRLGVIMIRRLLHATGVWKLPKGNRPA